MENDILDEYEYLLSDLLMVIGTLKIVHRYLDDALHYYEFDMLKTQYADILCLAIAQLDHLINCHQQIVELELKNIL